MCRVIQATQLMNLLPTLQMTHNNGTNLAQRSPDDHQRIQSGEEGVAWQCTHTIQLQRCSSVEALLV